MPKLNQILAIEKGEKTKATKALSELHHKSQKAPLYEGRVRTYKPADEEGEQLPPEKQLVQLRSTEVLEEQSKVLQGLWDLTATKDWANASVARVDLVVDDKTLIESVPVSYLLFLEKQLTDVETFVAKLPTLDPSVEWTFSQAQDCYVSPVDWTNRSKKVMRNHLKAEATKEHPAQVDTYSEDVVIGKYESIRHSGAINLQYKTLVLERVRKLKKAVLFAREQANNSAVEHKKVSGAIFDYLYAT